MQLVDLQTLAASLLNDPTNTRYSLADISQEIDNTIGQWNAEVKIIKQTTTIAAVLNQRQYALTLITGTPVSFPRVTFKGIDMKKRSKAYFDLYTSYNWEAVIGTPMEYFVEATDPASLYLTVYPIPQSGDVGGNFVVECIIAHTPMSASTDVPFMSGTASNYLLRPYDFYIAYSAAGRLIARDPTPENIQRQIAYQKIGHTGKDLLIGIFKELESEEPRRMQGGRQW